MSDRFNKYVSMDLKLVGIRKVWILHLIDAATRYTRYGLLILEPLVNLIVIAVGNLQMMCSAK